MIPTMVVLACVAVIVILAMVGRRIRRGRERAMDEARSRLRDAELGEAVREMGARSGSPRGLRWLDCELTGESELLRNQSTDGFLALVGVVLHFEAIEGGDMEDVEAVSLPRSATAVVLWDGRAWQPTGRVIMNHGPAEALERFGDQIISKT